MSNSKFKILPRMEQGTPEWLAWRTGGFGASDAPLFMNGTHYERTYESLVLQYIKGDHPPVPSNWAMEQGKRFEPLARAWYESRMRVEAPPLCCESLSRPFLRASLDGFVPLDRENPAHGGVVLEIKYASREAHLQALNDQVPPKYLPQLLHQCLVTGSDKIHYVSGNPRFEADCRFRLVRFSPDPTLLARLLLLLEISWRHIQEKKPLTFRELHLLADEEGGQEG